MLPVVRPISDSRQKVVDLQRRFVEKRHALRHPFETFEPSMFGEIVLFWREYDLASTRYEG